MKNTLTTLVLLLALSLSAQKNISIIKNSNIRHFYEKVELEELNKSTLKILYFERIASLSNIIPYLALTVYPNISYIDIGIPDTSDNQKLFKRQKSLIDNYLKDTLDFQENIIPYANKDELIEVILFYEQILKNIKQMRDNR